LDAVQILSNEAFNVSPANTVIKLTVTVGPGTIGKITSRVIWYVRIYIHAGFISDKLTVLLASCDNVNNYTLITAYFIDYFSNNQRKHSQVLF
jgi:hypothetical protein